ncbi:MAG TPA: AAA family ATPase [Terriglobales bacterium]|nr:AAA family ATPase [Terriglobales bacterium]
MPVSFLHTANFQIGKGFGSIDPEAAVILRRQRIEAVRRIAEVAAERRVDAVLVAGDVFDFDAVSNETVHSLLQAFSAYTGPWVVIPGNHDPAVAGSVWHRIEDLTRPASLHVSREPEVLELADGRLAVLTAPLQRRHEARDLTSDWDTIATPVHAVRVGLAHGAIASHAPAIFDAANPIAGDRELRGRLDYLALGDWHGTMQVGERSWYAGTPEPDHFRANDSGNVLLVSLENPGSMPLVEKIPVGRYRWFELSHEINHAADLAALDRKISEIADPFHDSVVKLVLSGAIDLDTHVKIDRFLEAWRGRLLYLREDIDGLVTRPTDADLDRIDTAGFRSRRPGALAPDRCRAPRAGSHLCQRRDCAPLSNSHGRRCEMIIRKIEVRNFRKLAEPVVIDGLGPGATLIAGDNEDGKSTLVEAIRTAFFVKHSITGEFADAMQPYNSNVRPEVRIEFELDGQVYRLFKAYCQRPQAELVTPAATFNGSAAEEHLSQLLRVSLSKRIRKDDREHEGVFGMFWVEQGKSLVLEPNAAGRTSILEALQKEVGDVLGGKRGQRLIAEVSRRHEELLTGAGKPRGAYASAMQAVRDIGVELATVEGQLADHCRTTDELERCISKLAQYEREGALGAARERLGGAQRASEKIAGLQNQVHDADLALQAANARRQCAADQAAQRGQLVEVLALADSALKTLAESLAADRAALPIRPPSRHARSPPRAHRFVLQLLPYSSSLPAALTLSCPRANLFGFDLRSLR